METLYEKSPRSAVSLSQLYNGKPLCWCCPSCLEAQNLRKLEYQRLLQQKQDLRRGDSSSGEQRSNSEEDGGSPRRVSADFEITPCGGIKNGLSGHGGVTNGHGTEQNGVKKILSIGVDNGWTDEQKINRNNHLSSPAESSLINHTDLPYTVKPSTDPHLVSNLSPSSPNSHPTMWVEAPVAGGQRWEPRNWFQGQGQGSEESEESSSDTDDLEDLYGGRVSLEADPLEHLIQVLRYHPQYLDCFLDTHRYLLYGNGPLPYHHRHYIAIMAAARNRCGYLVHAESALFIMQGGERAWLRGLDHVPRKLRLLNDLNRLLAHRPWLLHSSHINALVRDPHDKWSLSELAHAIVLLSHFHSLSSFIQGCGISDDTFNFSEESSRSLSGSTSGHSPREGATLNNGELDGSCLSIEELIEKMRLLGEGQMHSDVNNGSIEDVSDGFEEVESLTMDLKASHQQKVMKEELKRYIEDPEYSYQDFYASRSAEGSYLGSRLQTYIVQEYSWEDQGYSLASRLYMEIGSLLDEKFNLAQHLTYFTCGANRDIDTTLFREAVWKFVHCLYGIRNDDYDYALVSRLLDQNLRLFIKATACYPDTVSKSDYNRINADFQQSEKVHINIMIMEARMQSELMYGLRAVSRHMTEKQPAHSEHS